MTNTATLQELSPFRHKKNKAKLLLTYLQGVVISLSYDYIS